MPGSPFPPVAPLGLGLPPNGGTTGGSDFCLPSRPPPGVPCQPIPCGVPVFLCPVRSQGNSTERHRENWSPGSPFLPDRDISTRSQQISQGSGSPLCTHAPLSDPGWLNAPPSLSAIKCGLPPRWTTSASHDCTTFQGSITQPAYWLHVCFTVRLAASRARVASGLLTGVDRMGLAPTG